MSLSLRELKEYLKSKGGYSTEPNHSQLQDLKSLVDDMMEQRSGTPPSSGSGSYSGVTCTEHMPVGDYNLSLGDINTLDIKGCSCNEVNDTTGYCTGRTYRPTCSCNVDTYCDCESRTYASACICNSRTPEMCECQSRTGTCTCDMRTACDCKTRTAAATCTCNTRGGTCDCQSRTYTSTCTCNGRCACNAEDRFE